MTEDPLIVCPDCAQAPCVTVCPTHAIIATELHTVLVQNDLCIGCGCCTTACPFDRLEVDCATCSVARKSSDALPLRQSEG